MHYSQSLEMWIPGNHEGLYNTIHIKCDFLTRLTQNPKQIASVPPTNNNNCVQLNLTSWQFEWKARNAHLFTTTHKYLNKYHTWYIYIYIYKPDWCTVILFLAIMWTFNDCHLRMVMFLRYAIHANISSSRYQITRYQINSTLLMTTIRHNYNKI